MKKTLLLFILSISLQVVAQKDFEGMIKYKIITPEYINDNGEKPGIEKDSADVLISMIPGKIRIIPADKDVLLVILDSAKVYTINHDRKTYWEKRLYFRKKPSGMQKEIIAGYSSTVVQQSAGISMLGGSATMWVADSLFYHIPPGLEHNEELLFIQNNKIVLKAVIGMDERMIPEEEKLEEQELEYKPEFQLLATAIIPGAAKPDDFLIPSGYIKERANSHSMDLKQLTDTSVVELIDSVAVPAPVDEKRLPPPPIPKTPKKTNTGKSSARKE